MFHYQVKLHLLHRVLAKRILALCVLVMVTVSFPVSALAQSEGDPVTISLRVFDASGTAISYAGEICFRIDAGGTGGSLDTCVTATTIDRLVWEGFSAPAPGFGWATSATIVSDTTGCGAAINYESGPDDPGGTGTYVVGYGIRTACPALPAPSPTPLPTATEIPPTPDPSVGSPLAIMITTLDASGTEFALPGEICLSLNLASTTPYDTCINRVSATSVEIGGFLLPAPGHNWGASATLLSDTTECGASVSYASGPNVRPDGSYLVQYILRTSCPVTPTPTITPAEPPAAETPTPTGTVPQSFTLLTASRACSNQQFSTTWAGSGIANIEFSLTNTSDGWTSGWLSADPASTSFSSAVDHHTYDKVQVRTTFANGEVILRNADVGTCDAPSTSEPPAPAPIPTTAPNVVNPPPASGGGSVAVVTSLPDTGIGMREGIVYGSAIALALGAFLTVIALWYRVIARR